MAERKTAESKRHSMGKNS